MPGNFIFKPIEAKITHDLHWFTKMDPYCVFITGDKRINSEVCKKGDRNPHWEDIITIDSPVESKILVEVMDKTTFSDGNIGTSNIDLEEIESQGKISKWYPLTFKENPAGEILIESAFEGNNNVIVADNILQEPVAIIEKQAEIHQEEAVIEEPTKTFVEQKQVVEPHTFLKEVDTVETREVEQTIEVMEPRKVIKDVEYTEVVPVKKQIETVEPRVVKKEIEVMEPMLVTKEIQVVENFPVIKKIQVVESVPVMKEVETFEPQTFTKQIEVTEQVPVMKTVIVSEPVHVKKAVEFAEPIITTETITKEIRPEVIVNEEITKSVGPASMIVGQEKVLIDNELRIQEEKIESNQVKIEKKDSHLV